MARHHVKVLQLRPDHGTAFAAVVEDHTGVGLVAHASGGGDVRIRMQGGRVWFRSGDADFTSEDDLHTWRRMSPGAMEFVVDGCQLIPVAAPASEVVAHDQGS